MRKIVSLVLTLTVLLVLSSAALATQTEEATPQVAMTASAEKVEAGKTVTLTLSLTGELKDISSFEYYIHYNPTVVTLTESKVGDSSALVKVGTPPAENYTKTETDNAITVSAVSFENDGKFTMAQGTIATLTFTAKDDAAADSSAGFVLEKVAVCDSTFEDTAVAVQTTDAPGVTIGTTILLGDVNGDGTVNHVDAAMVYGYYNGKVTFTDNQLSAADVNGDGAVNHVDAAMIYGFYNGKVTKFPKG